MNGTGEGVGIVAKAKKLPSGNWRVQAYDKDTQKYKSFTAPSKKEAELAALEWRNGKELQCNDKTVGDCIDDYINSKKNVLSPTTISGYEKIKRNNLSEVCGVPINKFTAIDIQKLVNKLALTKSPKTVRNVHGLLVSVLNVYAPELHISTTLPAMQKKIKRLPTVDTVIAAVVGSELELPCLLAIWEGLRMSEIRGLKKSDIQGNILTIQRTIVTVEGRHIEKNATKTYESTRQIRLSPYLLNLINKLPAEQEYLTDKTSAYIYKHFQKILNDNNVEHMTFHDLRHLNASTMLALGIPDKYAMERGGWSSPNIMKSVYQHTFSSERDNVDKLIDDFFQKKIENITQNVT